MTIRQLTTEFRRAADDAETRLVGSGLCGLVVMAVLLLIMINVGILTAV